MLDYTNSSTIYLSQSEGNDHYSGFSPVASVGGAGPVRTMGRVMDMLEYARVWRAPAGDRQNHGRLLPRILHRRRL